MQKILDEIFVRTNQPIENAAIRLIFVFLSRKLERDTEIADADQYTSDIDEILADLPHNDDPLAEVAYKQFGLRRRTDEEINTHQITKAYRQFVQNVYTERKTRPAALRDIMYFPADIDKAKDATTSVRLCANKPF